MSGPKSRWRDLLALALPALDHVFKDAPRAGAAPHWTLGGGTALAIRLKHRISFDIDLFIAATRLELFTPARNPKAALIADTFQWPGHCLQYERPEGEVDFLSSVLQTDPGYGWVTVRGRPIAVETLDEVIVNKLRYRSASLKARDVFDLASVFEAQPAIVNALADHVADALPRVRESVELRRKQGLDRLVQRVVLTEKGRGLLPRVFGLALEAISAAETIATARISPARNGTPPPR